MMKIGRVVTNIVGSPPDIPKESLHIPVRNEMGVVCYLREKLPQLIPKITKARIRTRFPDLTVYFDSGEKLYLEIEYKLSSFFNHKHHLNPLHKCHGIIFWVDDRSVLNKENKAALKGYQLFCIGPKKQRKSPIKSQFEWCQIAQMRVAKDIHVGCPCKNRSKGA